MVEIKKQGYLLLTGLYYEMIPNADTYEEAVEKYKEYAKRDNFKGQVAVLEYTCVGILPGPDESEGDS